VNRQLQLEREIPGPSSIHDKEKATSTQLQDRLDNIAREHDALASLVGGLSMFMKSTQGRRKGSGNQGA
jgi:hypothetical protein